MSKIFKLNFFIFWCILANYSYGQVSVKQYEEQVEKLKFEFSHEVFQKYNRPLVFNQWNADGKAFAQCRLEFCEIVIFSHFLKKHSLDQLNALLCHEMGHFLGVKHTNNSILSEVHHSNLAVEGEAEYFSTSICLKRITSLSDNKLREVAYKAITMLGEGAPGNIDGKNPYDRDVRLGTNMSYPSADCRYATLIAGIYLQPRPSCWFVPNELIPDEYKYRKDLF